MFTHHQKSVAIETGHNLENLNGAQVLQNLSQKRNLGIGKISLSNVQASKIHIGIAEFFLIPGYQTGDHVAGDVFPAVAA